MSIKVQEGRKFNFTMLENEIIDNIDRFSKSEVLAYMVLARHANNEDSCFPSYSTIAKKMRCSKRTAIDAIDSLEKKGVIKKQIRKNTNNKENNTNIYKLVNIVAIDEVDKNIKRQREEKSRRSKQIKELNENKNVKLVQENAPHIRIGRKQKISLIDLDFEILEKALERSLVYGANTFNYILSTYNTIVEEESNIQNNIQVEESSEEFKPNFEFTKTELHQVAYIKYIEHGYDSLNQQELQLVHELETAGLITLNVGA